MTKEQIIKLYIADLNNLVADSDAKRNRIMDLEDELETLKQGQSLPIDIVSQQRELLDLLTEIANSYTLYSNTRHRIIARKLLKSNCG